MILNSLMTVILCASFSFSKEKMKEKPQTKIPKSVQKIIQNKFPKSSIVKNVSCQITKKKINSFGVIISQPQKGADKPILSGLVAYKTKSQWKVQKIEKVDEHSSMADALNLFWSKEGFNKNYELLCATPGDKKAFLKANSSTKSFKGDPNYNAPQICFQTDDMYSNYACYSMPSKGNSIEQSHSQAFAD